MLFNSIHFLIFLPVIALAYYFIPQKYRRFILLIASYYFYMSWNPSLVFLILFSTVVTYAAALMLERYNTPAIRRLCVTASLVVCLGVLVFFKYYNFLAGTVTDIAGLFGVNFPDLSLGLILPVGISFYTFQTLSYVLDVYKGRIMPERDFVWFALYVSFFPQLVAGPIERPENLLPQLHVSERPACSDVRDALLCMSGGYFKKIVVADMLAPYVNRVFNAPADAAGIQVALASVMFAAQIYCDFSGYTDIAAGCSRLFGVRLMKNFDLPYTATGIRDFWRRWHISLTSWFRDYLYFPLGGSRCSLPRRFFNILVVFFVSGLWHGANWTFVLWGLLHGIYQLIEIILDKPCAALLRKIGAADDNPAVLTVRKAATFIFVCFAWIFFRANNVADLVILLRALFTGWEMSLHYCTDAITGMGLTAVGALTALVSVYIMSRIDRGALSVTVADNPSLAKPLLIPALVCIIWTVTVAWFVLLKGDGASSFIYFQF